MLGPKQQAWLTALRSGLYFQGKGVLFQKNPDGPDLYCPLGVLCDINNRPGQWGFAPNDLAAELGLRDQVLIQRYNDILGLTFDQIADRIENDPKFYFNKVA